MRAGTRTDRVTVDQVVKQVWIRRVRAGRPDWAGPMGPSDIRLGLMKPMALRRVGVPSPTRRKEDGNRPGGGRLRRDERFDHDDGETVRAWFDGDGWDLLITLCGRAREVADRTLATLEGTEALVNRREVRAWALRTVGRAHWDGIDAPTLDDLADRMREFQEQEIAFGPLQRLRMNEQDFLAEVRAEWDLAWPPDRPALPPRSSALGLGSDTRPPLEGSRGNWHLGTDRSVYSRYRRYSDASTQVRPPSDPEPDPEQHVTHRFRGARPVDIALTEVHRAAAPLGLGHAGHRVALVATADGLLPRSDGSLVSTDLHEWAARGTDLPTEADDELVDAISSHTVDRIANAWVAGELGADTGLRTKIVRRLWQRLHGREVEWEVPLSRVGFATDLRDMYYHHLVERHDPPPAEERPPAVDLAATEPGYADRVHATNAAIRDHPERQAFQDLLGAEDPGWQAVYRRIADGRPDLLTLAEFCSEYGLEPPEES